MLEGIRETILTKISANILTDLQRRAAKGVCALLPPAPAQDAAPPSGRHLALLPARRQDHLLLLAEPAGGRRCTSAWT
jgi:hypothetical protein